MKLLLDKGADPNARVAARCGSRATTSISRAWTRAGATPFWRAAYASDVAAMKLLVSYGADPSIADDEGPFSRRGPEDPVLGADKSGLPPIPDRRPRRHAAAGGGRRRLRLGFAGNSHHVAPGGMLPAVQYLVEEAGADVNAVDADGNTAVHHAAVARRQRDDSSIWSRRAPTSRRQSRRPDDDRCREWSGAADAAVSGDDRAARRAGREEQPQVRVVLSFLQRPQRRRGAGDTVTRLR